MAVFTTSAFVLRTFPHKESDLVVRLYTEQFGRLAGIARGARRPKSALAGRLEILQLGEVKGFRSPGRELCSVDTIASLEGWTRLRSSLEGFYRIHYVAELLDLALEEEQPHPELFRLVGGLLVLLDDEAIDADLGLRALELKVLEELGYGLSFGACVSCHEANRPAAGFEPGEGGFVCESCVKRLPEALKVSGELVELVVKLAPATLAELGALELPGDLRRPLRELCHRMLLYRLERPLRSARYLEELEEGLR